MIAVGPHKDLRFLQGVAAFARQKGYLVNPLPWAMGFFDEGTVGQSDGIIGVFGPFHHDALAAVQRYGLPLVSLGGVPQDANIPAACPDYRAVGRLAADHLIECGYRHLLVYRENDQMVAGALAAASAAGIEAQVCAPLGSQGLVEAREAAGGAVGVVAVPDAVGALTIQRALAAGLAVPESVGVVGAGNVTTLCELGAVPLTSVEADHFQVGFEAGRLMDKLLRGVRVPRGPVIVPPQGVVRRRSTDSVMLCRPEVAAAVAYIREHFQRALTPQEVARSAGLCRRRLDQVFLREIGRTVADEITARRVRAAADMLAQSSEAVGQIARRCGFIESRALWRSFKRTMACTPEQYRAAHIRA